MGIHSLLSRIGNQNGNQSRKWTFLFFFVLLLFLLLLPNHESNTMTYDCAFIKIQLSPTSFSSFTPFWPCGRRGRPRRRLVRPRVALSPWGRRKRRWGTTPSTFRRSSTWRPEASRRKRCPSSSRRIWRRLP